MSAESTATSRVAVLNDLHMKVPFDSVYANEVAASITTANVELVIFNGDIVDMDGCGGSGGSYVMKEECTRLVEDVAIALFDLINMPFLFSLGNHDGYGEVRLAFATAFATHPLHAATACNEGYGACVYEPLQIALLDSGTYDCDAWFLSSHYACPEESDSEWIDGQVESWPQKELFLLATHMPPPEANLQTSFRVQGQRHETMRCWREAWLKDHLPSSQPRIHIYGHDHDNLAIYQPNGGATKYTYGLKSGQKDWNPADHAEGEKAQGSFGPKFSSPGFTTITHVSDGGDAMPLAGYDEATAGAGAGLAASHGDVLWRTFDGSPVPILEGSEAFDGESCWKAKQVCVDCKGFLIVYFVLAVVLITVSLRRRHQTAADVEMPEKKGTGVMFTAVADETNL